MTLEKITKAFIKIGVIYIALFLMFGCVTKKKFKESQELQSIYILDQTESKFTNSIQKLKSDIKEETVSTIREYQRVEKTSTSTNENEKTDISVSITAEDGKEKSATIGNTTIKSNGADITVKTISTKQENIILETINQELTQTITRLETSLKTLENSFNEKIEVQKNAIETLKSQLETKTKETNKKGLSFWVIIIAIISALLFVAYKLYGNSIIGKFKGYFKTISKS